MVDSGGTRFVHFVKLKEQEAKLVTASFHVVYC